MINLGGIWIRCYAVLPAHNSYLQCIAGWYHGFGLYYRLRTSDVLVRTHVRTYVRETSTENGTNICCSISFLAPAWPVKADQTIFVLACTFVATSTKRVRFPARSKKRHPALLFPEDFSYKIISMHFILRTSPLISVSYTHLTLPTTPYV